MFGQNSTHAITSIIFFMPTISEITVTQYVGILDGSGTVWGVRVPDLPGCHGGGETPEAAIARRRLGGSRMGRA